MNVINQMTELSAVGEVINRLHEEICENANVMCGKAIQAGELLAGQKSKLEHGEWLDWLKFNCPSISTRTAQRYMSIASGRNESELKYDTESPTESVFQLLSGLFTIEEEKGSPGKLEIDPDLGHEGEKGEDEEGDNSGDDSGDDREGAGVKTQSGARNRAAAAESTRPSPQDVIRAANQMEMAEKAISEGMKPFLEVSEALLLIKQNRLYEIADFRSFEEYCSERWGFNYRLTKRNSG